MMNRSSLLLVSALTATTSLFVGCSDSGVKETPAPTAKNTNVITLGLVGSFAGADGDVANQVRLGAELAASQINAAGGILGRQIVFRIEDDAGRDSVAREKMEALIADGVTLGLGPTSSASAAAVLDIARADRMLFISPSASSPTLDLPVANGDQTVRANLLRTVPSDDLQASAMVVVAAQNREQLAEDSSLKTGQARCSSAIFVYQKDAYGTPIYTRALKRLLDYNISAARTVELNPLDVTESTLRGSAGQVANGVLSLNANCQLVIAQPQLAGAYMRAFRDFIADPAVEVKRDWPSFTTLGSDGFTQDAFVTAGRTNPADPLSDTAGNGSVAVAANTRPQTQTFALFREAYLARNPGQEPGQFASTAYDAVIMLSLAVEKTKSVENRPALRQALADLSLGETATPTDLFLLLSRVRAGVAINYEGVSGGVDFLPTGAVDGNFVIGRVVKNHFVQFRKTLESSTLPR
jgi:ABC-type branched-subunit amino acid transport system substrate-binding protein